MAWLRRNYIAIIISLALVAAFVFNQQDIASRAHDAKVDDVASCVRANTRSALSAASQRFTGNFVRRQGLPHVADVFAEYSHGSATYLAISRYMNSPENATRVHTIMADGEPSKVLTSRSEELIIEGCSRAFHASGDEIPEDFPALGLQP